MCIRDRPGSGAFLKQKLLPFADKEADAPPGIFEVILRSSLLGSVSQSQHNRYVADLYINPPVEKFGLLQFGTFDEVVQAGYDHANRVLDARDGTLFD